ncbi:hypothetical protein M9978_02285 [Sphingomonas sp. MG17]|uniref:Uncharacterized protein n=1 Tax=Sphingomonas tagetis TaxID=2949092 RepID=A0A9X2HK18_9SPHN|nr:hypothetical protein [Sphingomonas tagetis]MCP3729244.1 hypothetical protein [Sphingomonas tagetis]
MTWFKSGTIAIVNGSDAVTGTSTAWSAQQILPGFALVSAAGVILGEVETVNSPTSITLVDPVTASTASGINYLIVPTRGSDIQLFTAISQLITDYAAVRDNAGQGMFGDGSVGTPGMRFINDQDTGISRPGSNILAIGTAGVERFRADTNGVQVAGLQTIYPAANPTSVATAKQLTVGEMTKNTSYNLAFGYFLGGDEVWRGSIQAISGGTGTPLAINANGGNVAIGKVDPGSYRLSIAKGDNNLLQIENTVGNGTKITMIDQAWSAEIEQSQGNLIFKAGGTTERARVDTLGNLLVGATSGSYHIVRKTAAEGNVILQVDANAYGAVFYGAADGGANGAATTLSLGKNSGTNRSINAGGTINASGADYAEYMTKAEGCGTIAPGDVCGVDANGLLVTAWAQAISFVVKSTAPSLVGGDTWAAGLDPKPEPPEGFGSIDPGFLNPDYASELEQYEDDLAEWEAALEAARQTVDRIAFSGQVPVNVGPATLDAIEDALEDGVGVYLVAAQAGASIAAAAVLESDMTLPVYMRRLGKVWAVREGCPWIDVQHG